MFSMEYFGNKIWRVKRVQKITNAILNSWFTGCSLLTSYSSMLHTHYFVIFISFSFKPGAYFSSELGSDFSLFTFHSSSAYFSHTPLDFVLLIPYNSLLTNHCSFLTTGFPHHTPLHSSLFTSYSYLSSSYCSLFTAHSLLHIYRLLFITFHILSGFFTGLITPHWFLLTIHSYLITTSHSLLFIFHFSINSISSLLNLHCSLIITHHSFLTTSLFIPYSSLLTLHCSLIVFLFSLLISHSSLLTSHLLYGKYAC